jgi:hypothetical protein
LVGTPEGAEAQPVKNNVNSANSRESSQESRLVSVMTMQGIV